METRYCICLLFLCLISVSNGSTNLETLTKLSEKSATNIISLTSNTFAFTFQVIFSQFLQEKRPLPYVVIILFTVKSNCDLCLTIESFYKSIALSYQAQLKDKPQNIFFTVIEYNQHTERLYSQVILIYKLVLH
jgi:hypothetical protein